MKGYHADVLDHATACDGDEYSTMRPISRSMAGDHDAKGDIDVVLMAWCGDCFATFWEVV